MSDTNNYICYLMANPAEFQSTSLFFFDQSFFFAAILAIFKVFNVMKILHYMTHKYKATTAAAVHNYGLNQSSNSLATSSLSACLSDTDTVMHYTGVSWVNNTHAPGQSHCANESITHQTSIHCFNILIHASTALAWLCGWFNTVCFLGYVW